MRNKTTAAQHAARQLFILYYSQKKGQKIWNGYFVLAKLNGGRQRQDKKDVQRFVIYI